jgi:hypothetical protein
MNVLAQRASTLFTLILHLVQHGYDSRGLLDVYKNFPITPTTLD